MQNKSTYSLNCRGKLIDLSSPLVMGILNITTNSFYDGGKHNTLSEQLKQIEIMLTEGADIIDVGAMSSQPGATISEPEDELKKLVPVIEKALQNFPHIILSVDTIHAKVAERSLQAGAHIINDISAGLFDEAMLSTVAQFKNAPYIMMHMKGTPKTMQQNTQYNNLMVNLVDYLVERIYTARQSGILDVIIDPGIGFSKTVSQNYEILNRLSELKILNCPLLIGLSRKSLIWKTLQSTPEEALNGTSVLHTIALLNGSHILRVHDVKEAKETITLVQKLNFVGCFFNLPGISFIKRQPCVKHFYRLGSFFCYYTANRFFKYAGYQKYLISVYECWGNCFVNCFSTRNKAVFVAIGQKQSF